MLSLLYLRVKAQQYFESLSYMFLHKITLLKIWLNPGLNISFDEPCPDPWEIVIDLRHFRNKNETGPS